MKLYLPHILAVAMILTLAVGCSTSDSETTDNSSTQLATASTGTVAAFSAYDVDGNLHQSSEWIGQKPVIINFWGTWCPPCRREIPALVELYEEYGPQGIEIVSLAMEKDKSPADVARFAEQNNMKWPMLIADMEILKTYRIQSFPTTIFVDKNGNAIPVSDNWGQNSDRFIGAQSHETFKAAFDKLLES